MLQLYQFRMRGGVGVCLGPGVGLVVSEVMGVRGGGACSLQDWAGGFPCCIDSACLLEHTWSASHNICGMAVVRPSLQSRCRCGSLVVLTKEMSVLAEGWLPFLLALGLLAEWGHFLVSLWHSIARGLKQSFGILPWRASCVVFSLLGPHRFYISLQPSCAHFQRSRVRRVATIVPL